MIFKQIVEILSGQKTQTRRRMKPNEFANQWRDDVTDLGFSPPQATPL